MRRKPTSICLNEREKRIIKRAAERENSAYTTWLRDVALDHALDLLEEELEEVREEREQPA